MLMDIDHPGLNLTRNMLKASEICTAIRDMLAARGVKRLLQYRVMVDYTATPDAEKLAVTYSFCLRVYPHNSRTPVLTRWSETVDGLVSEDTMALLLVLYNS